MREVLPAFAGRWIGTTKGRRNFPFQADNSSFPFLVFGSINSQVPIMLRWASLLISFALAPQLLLADCPQTEHSLGGLSIGATEAQVISVLGKPTSRPRLSESETHVYDAKLVFPEATAYFVAGKLDNLRSFRKNICTPGNICPGTSETEVQRILGPGATESEPIGESISCFSTASACSLVVLLQAGKTRALELQCAP
jgi:hypothetical protein